MPPSLSIDGVPVPLSRHHLAFNSIWQPPCLDSNTSRRLREGGALRRGAKPLLPAYAFGGNLQVAHVSQHSPILRVDHADLGIRS
jgi:hypothetical protein